MGKRPPAHSIPGREVPSPVRWQYRPAGGPNWTRHRLLEPAPERRPLATVASAPTPPPLPADIGRTRRPRSRLCLAPPEEPQVSAVLATFLRPDIAARSSFPALLPPRRVDRPFL